MKYAIQAKPTLPAAVQIIAHIIITPFKKTPTHLKATPLVTPVSVKVTSCVTVMWTVLMPQCSSIILAEALPIINAPPWIPAAAISAATVMSMVLTPRCSSRTSAAALCRIPARHVWRGSGADIELRISESVKTGGRSCRNCIPYGYVLWLFRVCCTQNLVI